MGVRVAGERKSLHSSRRLRPLDSQHPIERSVARKHLVPAGLVSSAGGRTAQHRGSSPLPNAARQPALENPEVREKLQRVRQRELSLPNRPAGICWLFPNIDQRSFQMKDRLSKLSVLVVRYKYDLRADND